MINKNMKKEEVLKIADRSLGDDCETCNAHCCKYGSGYFLPEDIKKLAEHLKMSEEEAIKEYLEEVTVFNTNIHRAKQIKHRNSNVPHGQCMFLGQNYKCVIHDVKPFHCKLGTCTDHGEDLSIWFTLNHLVNKHDPESVRQWATYLKTHKTIPGGSLKDIIPDEEKLKKILSYEMLK